MKTIKQIFLVVSVSAITLALTIALAIAGGKYMNGIPDVYVSSTTGKCRNVDNYGDKIYTCANLPERYNTVWVE